MASATLYTIGYKGTTIEPFLGALKAAGIERLIDVRKAARSRKADFNKNRLKGHIEAVGLEYIHHAAVGAPNEARKDYLADGDWDAFVVRYLEHLETDESRRGLDELEALAKDKVSAIACLCPDVTRCHRGVLSARLADRGFSIEHLVPLDLL